MPNRGRLIVPGREPERRVLARPTEFDPFTDPQKVRTSRIRATTTTDVNGRGVLTITIPGRGLHPVVLSRLIAAIEPQSGQALTDSFTRTVAASSWGTPDFGPAYQTPTGGSAGAGFSVNGTQGLCIRQANGTPAETHSNINRADVTFNAQLVNFGSAIAGNHFRLIARVKDSSNYYGLRCITNAVPQIATAELFERVAGVETTFATVAVGPLAFPVQAELIISGTTLEGRVYVGTRPLAPTVSASDTDITGVGGAGMSFFTDAAVRTFTVDNLSVVGSSNVPSWAAYLNDPTFLVNIVEASPEPVNLWVPQIVNGQQFFPGDVLQIVGTGAPPSTQMISTGHVLL